MSILHKTTNCSINKRQISWDLWITTYLICFFVLQKILNFIQCDFFSRIVTKFFLASCIFALLPLSPAVIRGVIVGLHMVKRTSFHVHRDSYTLPLSANANNSHAPHKVYYTVHNLLHKKFLSKARQLSEICINCNQLQYLNFNSLGRIDSEGDRSDDATATYACRRRRGPRPHVTFLPRPSRSDNCPLSAFSSIACLPAKK